MKKVLSILTHPFLIIIILILLYSIGVKNNYINSVENIKLHFLYLIFIIIILGFISNYHFTTELDKFKITDYNSFEKISFFKSQNYWLTYQNIYSEGIEQDDPSHTRLKYIDHLICYYKSEYSSHHYNYLAGIFFLNSFISIFNQIYINESLTLTYFFINFYFTICMFLIYLKIFDWAVKIKIKEELGCEKYLIHFNTIELNREFVKLLLFYIATIIIIFFFILKYYNIF